MADPMIRFQKHCGSTVARWASVHRNCAIGRLAVLLAILCGLGLSDAVQATTQELDDVTILGAGPTGTDSFSIASLVTLDQDTTLTGGNFRLDGFPVLTLAFPLITSGPHFLEIAAPMSIDGTFSASTDASGNAALRFQAIPEPQTWLVAFSGLGALLALQRFRRGRNKSHRP
jgi:hypothetical protein